MTKNNTIYRQLKEAKLDTFKDLETFRFKECQELFTQVLKEDLLTIDDRLAEERDKKRYYLKDKRVLQFQTMFGFVEVKRNYYYDRQKEKFVCLLDQFLNINSRSGFSPMVEEYAMELAVTGPSYREAVAAISQTLGYQVMSHESLRQLILQAQREMSPSVVRGQRVLFIEVDGLFVKHQRQHTRGRELKFAAVHEGWTKIGGRTRLIHKRHYRHENTEGSFWEGLEQFLLDTYDYDPQTTKLVINGDGASWITACQSYFEEQCVFQLDKYHVARDIKHLFRDHPQERVIKQALAKNEVELFLLHLTSAQGTFEDPEKEEDLERLIAHLTENQQGLCDYRKVLQSEGIDTTGMRPMGSAESTMRVLGRRLKHGRAWSPRGMAAMADALLGKLNGFSFLPSASTDQDIIESKSFPPLSHYLRQKNAASKKSEQCGNLPYLSGSLGKPITEALKAMRGI